MTTDRELMQQALDALDLHAKQYPHMVKGYTADAAEAIRARLAQPEQAPTNNGRYLTGYKAQPEQEIESDRDHVEDDGCPTEKAVLQRFWREHQKQEPVAWRNTETGEFCTGGFLRNQIERWQPLYAAPPQREWQGLTDEEVRDFWSWSMTQDAEHIANTQQHAFARAIEAKLKEKNT